MTDKKKFEFWLFVTTLFLVVVGIALIWDWRIILGIFCLQFSNNISHWMTKHRDPKLFHVEQKHNHLVSDIVPPHETERDRWANNVLALRNYGQQLTGRRVEWEFQAFTGMSTFKAKDNADVVLNFEQIKDLTKAQLYMHSIWGSKTDEGNAPALRVFGEYLTRMTVYSLMGPANNGMLFIPKPPYPQIFMTNELIADLDAAKAYMLSEWDSKTNGMDVGRGTTDDKA